MRRVETCLDVCACGSLYRQSADTSVSAAPHNTNVRFCVTKISSHHDTFKDLISGIKPPVRLSYNKLWEEQLGG